MPRGPVSLPSMSTISTTPPTTARPIWTVRWGREVGSPSSGGVFAHADPDVVIGPVPVGDRVSGRIRGYLLPERRTGLTVDVEAGVPGFVPGFVDGEHLPFEVTQWPTVGSVTVFEVLRHDIDRRSGVCQVRLSPLEARFRNPRSTHWGSATRCGRSSRHATRSGRT